MSPIQVNLPYRLCVPTSTNNLVYAYQNIQNNTAYTRYTIRLRPFTGTDYIIVRTESSQYGYNLDGYNITNDTCKFEFYSEYSWFWFPLTAILSCGVIFFLIYRLLFRRFIK